MPRRNTIPVTSNLTLENYRKFQAWCEEENRGMASVIRNAIETYTGLDLSQPERGEYERHLQHRSGHSTARINRGDASERNRHRG